MPHPKRSPLPPPEFSPDILTWPTETRVDWLRRYDGPSFEIRKPDPDVHRALEHGWLWEHLWTGHLFTWQRWQYWNATACKGELLAEPIPEIELKDCYGPGRERTRKMLEASLECAVPVWSGQSSWSAFEFVLRWLLYAFGDRQQTDPPSGFDGASDRLYQVFNLAPMLLWPSDYWGNLFADSNVGKHAGFYPTPHSVSEMMAEMVMPPNEDLRLSSVCEPCIGTGRMALFAANRSMLVTGQDINPLCVLATKVNAWLYAPWMAVPIRWMWEHRYGAAEKGPETDEFATLAEPISLSRRGRALVAAGQEVLL